MGGKYVLHHGDCLDVMRSMDTESVDAIITDPPYGIDYQSAWRTDPTQRFKTISNDKTPFVWWLYDAFRLVKQGGCLICFCRWDVSDAFYQAIQWAGFKVGAQLVWDRINHGMGDPSSRPSPRHDLIWFAVKGRYQLPGKRPNSVYSHMRISGSNLMHPNQKPIELMRELVRDYTSVDSVILDPFTGSGTTGVAAVMESRRFVGVELDQKYAQIASERIESVLPKADLFSELSEVVDGSSAQ